MGYPMGMGSILSGSSIAHSLLISFLDITHPHPLSIKKFWVTHESIKNEFSTSLVGSFDLGLSKPEGLKLKKIKSFGTG
jgi:hypothetical protein